MAAFNVRAFGYRGLRQFPRVNPFQVSSDSVYGLEEPYEWAQLLAVNGPTPPPFITQSPDVSTILRVEVPAAQKIRYEINPPGRGVVVSAVSPGLTGFDNFPWGLGWSLSIADAASFA